MLSLRSSSNTEKQALNPEPPRALATVSTVAEQATISRSLVIKGVISGTESVYIDGQVEGTIDLPGQRVTIGRNGKVNANIQALDVVIMGAVRGDIRCGNRAEVRKEGSVLGDITAQRICVEDGAVLHGSVDVRAPQPAAQPVREPVRAAPHPLPQVQAQPLPPASEIPREPPKQPPLTTAVRPVSGSRVLFEEVQ
jgi:cytoskeletal protein CcmA (bactofilin family)